MNETNQLLRALLTAHVVANAHVIFTTARLASQPQYVKTDGTPGALGMYENINTAPKKSWEHCLKEAVDHLAENQTEVLQLLKNRNLISA